MANYLAEVERGVSCYNRVTLNCCHSRLSGGQWHTSHVMSYVPVPSLRPPPQDPLASESGHSYETLCCPETDTINRALRTRRSAGGPSENICHP